MLIEMLSYNFMIRVIIVGVLVSLCAALLGVTLVLKRYSMIGDGLSHVGFGALAVGAALNVAPMYVALPVVIVSAFLLLRISDSSKIKGDWAIAIISSSALAIGVTAASLSGMNTDINSYLFGSILTTSKNDAILSIAISLIVIVLYVFLYNRIFAVTFDENYSKATGINTSYYNTIISVFTALIIVIGMKIMGTLLISALIIFPAITSMRVCKKYKSVIKLSAVLSVLCFFTGIVISYAFNTPAGSSVVLVNLTIFILFWLFSSLRIKVLKLKSK